MQEFIDKEWRHPSLAPEVDGDYEVVGWYEGQLLCRWINDGSKYGAWSTIKGIPIDKTAIRAFRFVK